jgi:cytochrome P450 family 26 subfamily A
MNSFSAGRIIVGAIAILLSGSTAFQYVSTLALPASLTKHRLTLHNKITACNQFRTDGSMSPSFRTMKSSTDRHMNRAITTLKASISIVPVTRALCAVYPALRNAILFGAATLVTLKRRQILYPGSSADPKHSEPLPPGSFGCPFIGNNIFQGTKERGPGEFFRRASAKVGNAPIFKYMMVGQPTVSVAGMKNVKEVFNHEFSTIRTTPFSKLSNLFGTESLIMCSDSKEYSFLRRLVGAAMTNESVDKAIPSLQKTAREKIERILELPTAVMEDICTEFTLDVAWRQILGLNLHDAEVPSFRQAVKDWLSGLTSFRVMLLPGTRFTKAGRAHAYLVSLIENKIDELNRNGPDGSTLSAMIFAKDDLDGRRLSRQQVIDNSLLLIGAGSETAASTLTTGILLLGLHPVVFNQLKEEQKQLVAKSGDVLTLWQINKECPYLESVIKEIMRLAAIPGNGAGRKVFETLVVDGMQIPKGYRVGFNIPQTHANDPMTALPDGSHMDVIKGFKPERWLSYSTQPIEYMPFGYGARYCLGANLAMAEMKVFLALFARSVDFELVNMSKANVTWKKISMIPKPEDGTVIAPRPSASKK